MKWKIIFILIFLIALSINYFGYIIYSENKINEERVENMKKVLQSWSESKDSAEEEIFLNIMCRTINDYEKATSKQLSTKIHYKFPLWNAWFWGVGGKTYWNSDSTKVDSLSINIYYNDGYQKITNTIKPKIDFENYETGIWAE